MGPRRDERDAKRRDVPQLEARPASPTSPSIQITSTITFGNGKSGPSVTTKRSMPQPSEAKVPLGISDRASSSPSSPHKNKSSPLRDVPPPPEEPPYYLEQAGHPFGHSDSDDSVVEQPRATPLREAGRPHTPPDAKEQAVAPKTPLKMSGSARSPHRTAVNPSLPLVLSRSANYPMEKVLVYKLHESSPEDKAPVYLKMVMSTVPGGSSKLDGEPQTPTSATSDVRASTPSNGRRAPPPPPMPPKHGQSSLQLQQVEENQRKMAENQRKHLTLLQSCLAGIEEILKKEPARSESAATFGDKDSGMTPASKRMNPVASLTIPGSTKGTKAKSEAVSVPRASPRASPKVAQTGNLFEPSGTKDRTHGARPVSPCVSSNASTDTENFNRKPHHKSRASEMLERLQLEREPEPCLVGNRPNIMKRFANFIMSFSEQEVLGKLTMQTFVWRCLEDSRYNALARFYHLTMMMLIVASSMISWLETITKDAPASLTYNTTRASLLLQFVFLAELIARFSVCPDRSRFFSYAFNLLDLVITCGMIPTLLVCVSGMTTTGSTLTIINGFRVFFPTLLMLKLLRRFKTFTLLILACKQSSQALPVLLYVLLVICLAFTAVFYILEAPDNIADIQACFWYVIVTVATIGYGDLTPKTPAGRAVACLLITVGVLYVSIPIGIVGNCFSNVWEGRGQILAVETMREHVSWAGLTDADAAELFDEFDEDGDGTLNTDEFVKLLPLMGITLSKALQKEVFAMFDKQGDGAINMKEFVTVVFPDCKNSRLLADDDQSERRSQRVSEMACQFVGPMSTRKYIWRCMEDKNYNTTAKVYSSTMMGFVVISTMTSWLETVAQNAPASLEKRTAMLSLLLQFVFLAEFLVRFVACPDRKLFLSSMFNVLDLVIALGMIPILVVINSGVHIPAHLQKVVYGLRIFFPTLLMLKLLRRFKTTNLLLRACQRCAEALPVLLYTLFVICLAFTAVFYILESPDTFLDVRDCFWYVIVTVTTIGYGDMYPKTSAGRAVAGLLITIGVLYMAIPIGIVGNAFSSVWEAREQIQSVESMRELISWGGLNRDDILKLFEEFDEDNNGTLDFDEFRKFLRLMKINLPRASVKSVFETCDTDEDGTISMIEILTFLYPNVRVIGDVGSGFMKAGQSIKSLTLYRGARCRFWRHKSDAIS